MLQQENDAVAVIAGGLRELSMEELAELDRIVTPRAAALFAKAFGKEFYELLAPLTENDGPDGLPEGASSPHPDEKGLREMMRDPRYWRDRDPDHMDRVADGFRKLYSN